MQKKSRFLEGKRIDPLPIHSDIRISELIDQVFTAYNAARLREACHLYSKHMLQADVTVGMTLSGALSPAGMGISTFIPLIENGFVDWIVTTGANLYHDTHLALDSRCDAGIRRSAMWCCARRAWFESTTFSLTIMCSFPRMRFFREVISSPEFQKEMSTAEFHYLIGKYVNEREQVLRLKNRSLLAAAYRCGVPIYTSSPGDSSIGMNVAATAFVATI